MTNADLFNPIHCELTIVEEKLLESIDTELPLLDDATTHLLKAGGKRLRPAFALLGAKIFSDDIEQVIPMAVALELIHMATLVHDDVIDNSSVRRGRETVKSAWGNRVSIYAGNYAFARSLSMVAKYQRSDVVDVLADASMRICEGEIKQMMSCFDVNQGLKDYLRRIERKTALLISVSCKLGGMLGHASEDEIMALQKYGYYLGMAFQITDDILDFVADESILGKPVGSDIRQGVITLPAIYALQTHPNRKELAYFLSSAERSNQYATEIIDIIFDSNGIDYSYAVSCKYVYQAQKQLDKLPAGPVRECLFTIADFITEREY
ncbi:MAG: polyprenyl synthetase family protein [Bacillota bacterium]|nr:polyprenyl synthetase family protein [Bacillota bacterium]